MLITPSIPVLSTVSVQTSAKLHYEVTLSNHRIFLLNIKVLEKLPTFGPQLCTSFVLDDVSHFNIDCFKVLFFKFKNYIMIILIIVVMFMFTVIIIVPSQV